MAASRTHSWPRGRSRSLLELTVMEQMVSVRDETGQKVSIPSSSIRHDGIPNSSNSCVGVGSTSCHTTVSLLPVKTGSRNDRGIVVSYPYFLEFLMPGRSLLCPLPISPGTSSVSTLVPGAQHHPAPAPLPSPAPVSWVTRIRP